MAPTAGLPAGASTPQEVEIGGQTFVLLPKGDYKRLREDADRGREDATRFVEKSIGPDLRIRRRNAGLTLAEVAAGAGIRMETLSRIENGRTNPTLRTVQAVWKAIDLALVRPPASESGKTS